MKYPIGIQDFEDLQRNGCAYVDKTSFVYKLVDEGNITFSVAHADSERASFCLRWKHTSRVRRNSSRA